MLEIKHILVENQKENAVTDQPHPQFAFEINSDEKNAKATGYTIRITEESTGRAVWNTEEKETEDIQYITYAGEPLKPCTRYLVDVEIYDNHGNKAGKSNRFFTGFLGEKWEGHWITHPKARFGKKGPVPGMAFGKRFFLENYVSSAYVYITAVGIYTLKLNGNKIGEELLRPGYTSYEHQRQYQVYDVTKALKKGENVAMATVAGGWEAGRYGLFGKAGVYAPKQELLMELHITYTDGKKMKIVTDPSWRVSINTPILDASIYDGEVIDATRRPKNFIKTEVSDSRHKEQLLATYGNLPRCHSTLKPISVNKSKNGYIYDFGQNISGVVNFSIDGQEGQKLTFLHAEILMDGELYRKPLRSAKAALYYTCKKGKQSYMPQYTFMGFRYVEVIGLKDAQMENFTLEAKAISSITEETGSFSCSNQDITKLQQNIRWGGLDNFVDIPSDCPQRDERLGWTGDIAVFASTASFNFDMSRFLEKWLKDVRSEQLKKGGIPFVVPSGSLPLGCVNAGWGDCCILVPWALYQSTGNRRILEENYPMMKKYWNRVREMAAFGSHGDKKYLWTFGWSFGDWCAPGETQMQWFKKKPWISTAYFAYTSGIMSQIAGILDELQDQKLYAAVQKKIIQAYRKHFTDGHGKLTQEFQTAYVCPLHFGMTEGKESENYAKNLHRLVEEAGNHLTTGFLGTPYLLFALSDFGQLDKAYELLLQDTCPGWLYEVKAGGTTIWERWDALRPDGTVNLGEGIKEDQNTNKNSAMGSGMVSFNHYANGAVGDWLYRRAAGIEILEAGYRKFRIQPMPGGNLTWVECEKKTLTGTISSKWKIDESKFILDVIVPFGTTAEIILPDGYQETVGSGEYHYEAQISKLYSE